uniref:Calcium load-activated calcium channel n=1 Tax=Parastrongyloides trichosuri TaxID=131310 RepID=A0A0N4Z387_PARTI
MIQYCFMVIGISIFTALLGEGFLWFMIYRTDRYKSLYNLIEKQVKMIEKRKDSVADVSEKSKKRLEKENEKLKQINKDMTMYKMKSMIGVGLIFTGCLSIFNNYFNGVVVAKLPFVPFSFLQGISHRNIADDDLTSCSFIFLYILSTMSIRQNLQKMLGFQLSRTATKLTQGSGLLAEPSK